jgi:hypothetical protein
MRPGVQVVAVALLAAVGCVQGPAPPPKAAVAPPPAAKRVKLAILPVESDAFPRVASGLNALFHDVQVKGVDDYFLSKVTLEVVQLSIECVEQTSSCYEAVGKNLAAQRLLLGHIVAGPVAAPVKGKKKERLPSVKVTVTLFDVDSGAPAKETEQSFKNELDASNGLGELVQKTLGSEPAEVAGAKAASK